MPTFDPEQFANTNINESSSTQFVELPEGEYAAIVKDGDEGIKFRTIDTKNGPRTIMDAYLRVDVPPSVQEETGRKEFTVRYQCWLDFTENGGLDMRKGFNVALGLLRDACHLNVSGQTFNINMLKGKPVRIKTKNRKEGDAIYTDVANITSLS